MGKATHASLSGRRAKTRKLEAATMNLLLPGELQEGEHELLHARQKKNRASRAARARVADRLSAVKTGLPPTAEEYQGKLAHIDQSDEAIWTPEVIAAFMSTGLRTTDDLCAADLGFFFVCDPSNIAEAVLWRVSLQGGWTLHPTALLTQGGPSAHYHPAIATKRYTWASPEFQQEEPELFMQLRTACAKASSNWTLLPTIDTFVARKAKPSGRGATCIGVVSTREAADARYQNVPHVFGKAAFLEFVRKRDELRGSIGLCGM